MSLFPADEPRPVKCRAGCGRLLTDPESIRLGFGPCCARRLGLTRSTRSRIRTSAGGPTPDPLFPLTSERTTTMGYSATGILAYGYDLGGAEGKWKIRETSEDGELALPWLTGGDDGFTEQAEKLLLASVGFTETNWRVDGYFDRESEAKKKIGVTFKWHGHHDFSSVILAAHVVTAEWGDAVAVTPASADDRSAWAAQLHNALNVLGITPKQQYPEWLLCASYG